MGKKKVIRTSQGGYYEDKSEKQIKKEQLQSVKKDPYNERKDFEKLASEGTPSFVRSFAGNIKITLEPEDVSDLCNITVANLLEQLPRLPKESQALANRLVGLKAHIMPKAYDSLTQYIERGNL